MPRRYLTGLLFVVAALLFASALLIKARKNVPPPPPVVVVNDPCHPPPIRGGKKLLGMKAVTVPAGIELPRGKFCPLAESSLTVSVAVPVYEGDDADPAVIRSRAERRYSGSGGYVDPWR